MTPNMTARTSFQKEKWFGLVHISLAGARCGCVELSESAAAEPSFPVENKPQPNTKCDLKELIYILQANHK